MNLKNLQLLVTTVAAIATIIFLYGEIKKQKQNAKISK